MTVGDFISAVRQGCEQVRRIHLHIRFGKPLELQQPRRIAEPDVGYLLIRRSRCPEEFHHALDSRGVRVFL